MCPVDFGTVGSNASCYIEYQYPIAGSWIYLPFENNLFVYLGLLLDGNKQNHKNEQDHSANKFNKYQVIASIPEEHNLNLVAFGGILIYVHVTHFFFTCRGSQAKAKILIWQGCQ